MNFKENKPLTLDDFHMPLVPGTLFHGADYNPEQWFFDPKVVEEEDPRLMKAAHCNVMSIGMFSWSMLEPSEGQYELDWMEEIIDRLYENGIYTFLSTPSGARPAWMSQKYPEVLRVRADRRRNLHGRRHNHCLTSPIYREKVRAINGKLAERFLSTLAFSYGISAMSTAENVIVSFVKKRLGHGSKIVMELWTSSIMLGGPRFGRIVTRIGHR